MSDHARKQFMEDMRRDEFTPLKEQVEKSSDQVCFLKVEKKEESNYSFSRWIIMPDKRMILWNYQGERVLKWDASQFDSWKKYGLNLAGAIISPEGTLE